MPYFPIASFASVGDSEMRHILNRRYVWGRLIILVTVNCDDYRDRVCFLSSYGWGVDGLISELLRIF